MANIDLKSEMKKALLLSAGLFIVGKNKLQELVKDLEANGFTKEEAEKTAQEVLNSAKAHKDDFVKRITSEVEKRNVFATKEDVAKLQKTLEDISNKLEEE